MIKILFLWNPNTVQSVCVSVDLLFIIRADPELNPWGKGGMGGTQINKLGVTAFSLEFCKN